MIKKLKHLFQPKPEFPFMKMMYVLSGQRSWLVEEALSSNQKYTDDFKRIVVDIPEAMAYVTERAVELNTPNMSENVEIARKMLEYYNANS